MYAGFGWLNDPLLAEVQIILNGIQNKTGQVIPWTTAVPGASTNWTTVEDTRRRRNPDTFKTGKKNPNQVREPSIYPFNAGAWCGRAVCFVVVLLHSRQIPTRACCFHGWDCVTRARVKSDVNTP
jgi:hypothetical protein